MQIQQLKQRLNKLGYTLSYNQVDCFGKKHRYRTSPSQSGGPTNYFDNKEQIERFCRQVEQIREWQGV